MDGAAVPNDEAETDPRITCATSKGSILGKKILVYGMNRSGTTLTGDLIEKAPSVRKVFHEVVLINKDLEAIYGSKSIVDNELIQTKGVLTRTRNVAAQEYKVDFDLRAETWCNKISYPGPTILLDWMNRADLYAQRWLDYFGSDARVLHIVRHPFDVYVSARRRNWQGDLGQISNYGALTLDLLCRNWAMALDGVLRVLDASPQAMTFRYEDLVTEPQKMLEKIYRFCGFEGPAELAAKAVTGDVVFFGEVTDSRIGQYKTETLEPISRATAFFCRDFYDRFAYSDLRKPGGYVAP